MLDDKDEFADPRDEEVQIFYVESRGLLRSLVLAIIFSIPVWAGLITGLCKLLRS